MKHMMMPEIFRSTFIDAMLVIADYDA